MSPRGGLWFRCPKACENRNNLQCAELLFSRRVSGARVKSRDAALIVSPPIALH